ncbi:MAG TPA: hypothetical protein VI977_06435 [archaeon]|nr:hypothetical protein [archaeon]
MKKPSSLTIVLIALLAIIVGYFIFATLMFSDWQLFRPVLATDEAKTIIKATAAHKALPLTSRNVTFNPLDSLTATSVADGSNGVVADGQICLSAGDFASDANWVTSGTLSSVRYQGSTALQARLEAVCDSSNVILAKGIQNYLAEVHSSLNIDGVNWGNCPCLVDSNQTCCLLTVKKI